MAGDLKVGLEIAASTTGSDKIEALVTEVRALSGAIDPASAARAVELRQQIEALGGVTAKLGEQVKGVKPGADATGAALESAFNTLGVRSVAAVEAEINKLKAAMQVIRQSGSFMSPESLAAADSLRTKVAALETELKGVPGAASPAAGSITSVGTSSAAAQAHIANATLKVGAMVAAFAGISSLGDVAKNVINTGASFETLRVRLEQLLGSQEKAVAAFDMIKQLAVSTPFEVSNLTESYAKLTAYGLQPTEKQMRALADTAAAAGGGQQMLERVSLALGQAWAKQKLEGQEILQLTEAGVPIWDLLATATGKNVQELMRMSQAGELGRDAITKLWAAMGEKNAGASERLMHTFAGTVSNAKDAIAEFFDLISRSGVLEYLTKQIQGVLDEFDKLKQSGELEAKAKQISAAVTAMADVLKTAIEIVSKLSGAIKLLIEAMVIKQVAAFGASLLGLGAAATGATVEVAAAGVAAQAMGLRATVAAGAAGLLSRAMALIPGAAIVTGLTLAVGWLADKFMGAKKAAEEGDAAVAAMLNQKGTGGAAKAVGDVALAGDKAAIAVTKLESDISALASGKALSEVTREFVSQMAQSKAATDDVVKGLNVIGIQAAKNLGVDTVLATNKVTDAFKNSNDNLTVLISSLPNLKKEGVDTAALVGGAISKMIDGAKSQAEIDLINARLKVLGQVGILTGSQVAGALQQGADKTLELKKALTDSIPGFADLSKAAGKAGLDIGELSTGVSKKFKDSITDVDNLATAIRAAGTNAETAGPELAKALDQRLNAAQTTREVELVIAAVKKLGSEGLLTGDKLKEGLQKAQDKSDQLKTGINSVTEAYRQLGLKTPEELAKVAKANADAWDKIKTDTSLSTAALKTAFTSYAQSAIDAIGGIDSEQYLEKKAILETEAALNGLTIKFDEHGRVIVKTQREAQDELNKTRRAVDDVTAALERQNAALERTISAQEKKLDLAKRQQTLDYAKRGLDAEGWATNTSGQRVSGSFERKTPKGVYDMAMQGGATDAEAKTLADKFGTDITAKIGYSNIPGSFNALNHVFDQIKFDQALSDLVMSRLGTGSHGSTGSTGSTGSQTGGATNHTYTVNVVINGVSTPINVASEADAQALIAALQRAKGNAGG